LEVFKLFFVLKILLFRRFLSMTHNGVYFWPLPGKIYPEPDKQLLMKVGSSAERKIKCYTGTKTLNVLALCTYKPTVKTDKTRFLCTQRKSEGNNDHLSITAMTYQSMFLN
jgi:hypothetical protein